MPLTTRYLLAAAMDVAPDKDAVFNEVYDREHVPWLLEVPGVISVARFRTRELTMVIGGQRTAIVAEREPRYHAFYELERPDVLTSPAWATAVDRGRWPGEVRPHTRNRRHVLLERL
jgi:hypothetical protein